MVTRDSLGTNNADNHEEEKKTIGGQVSRVDSRGEVTSIGNQ